jgi:hypothetical protein
MGDHHCGRRRDHRETAGEWDAGERDYRFAVHDIPLLLLLTLSGADDNCASSPILAGKPPPWRHVAFFPQLRCLWPPQVDLFLG